MISLSTHQPTRFALSSYIAKHFGQYDRFLLSRMIKFNFPVVSNWNLGTTHKRTVCIATNTQNYCAINLEPIFQLHHGDCFINVALYQSVPLLNHHWPTKFRLAANLCVSLARYLWLLFIFSLVSAQCLGFIWKKKKLRFKSHCPFSFLFSLPLYTSHNQTCQLHWKESLMTKVNYLL
jgi:hypothetical protein